MEPSIDDPYPAGLLGSLADLPFSFYLIYGVVILLLLISSGLVSGSEVAYFSLSLDKINKSGGAENKKMRSLLLRPKQLLATILILNNLINVFIVTLSTYATWQIVGSKNAEGMVLFVLTTTITILIIFFGEIVPKVYASHSPFQFSKFTTPAIFFFNKFLRPISWLLMSISNVIEKRIERKGYNLSVDEINQALEITTEEETTEEEKGILKGIVNFGTLSVKQVMRSRMDITAIDKETDFHELMDQINKTGYSRIPIYSETIDKIEGILYIKDLLPHLHKSENFKWQKLLRESYFVPESKKIDDLLKDFQEMHVHMALVVDEYGGTEGLVTLEDIIEEIVGEINDEFDDDTDLTYRKIDSKTHVFEGKVTLNDMCKVLQIDTGIFDEVKGESESLGGLLLEINQRLPNSGEKIEFENFTFTIEAVDQKRIKRVKVFMDSSKPDKTNISDYED